MGIENKWILSKDFEDTEQNRLLVICHCGALEVVTILRWFIPIFEGTESVVYGISNLPVAFPFKLCFPSNYDVNLFSFEKKWIWSWQFGNTALKRLSVSCSREGLGLEIVSIPRFLTKYSLGGTLNLKTPVFVFIETLFITQLLCKALREAKWNEFGAGRLEIQHKIGCRLTGSREALELAQGGEYGFSLRLASNCSLSDLVQFPDEKMIPDGLGTHGSRRGNWSARPFRR